MLIKTYQKVTGSLKNMASRTFKSNRNKILSAAVMSIIILSSTIVLFNPIPRANATSITLDNSTTCTTNQGTTCTMTIGNNSNRILIVHIESSGSSSQGDVVSSVKIGSTAFTELAFKAGAASTYYTNTEVWYLIGPPTGSQTVTVTWSSTPSYSEIALISLYNVDQTTGISGSTYSTFAGHANDNPQSINITPTTAGSWILAVMDVASVGEGTPNHTAIYTNILDGGGAGRAAAQYNSAPTIGGSNTLDWPNDGTGNSNYGYSMIAFEVLSSSGGGGGGGSGITSINSQTGPAINIVRQAGNTTITNSTNQVQVGLGPNAVITGGAAQTISKQMSFSSNVGIGTTSPTQKLDITGNIRLSGNIVSSNSSATSIIAPNGFCIGKC